MDREHIDASTVPPPQDSPDAPLIDLPTDSAPSSGRDSLLKPLEKNINAEKILLSMVEQFGHVSDDQPKKAEQEKTTPARAQPVTHAARHVVRRPKGVKLPPHTEHTLTTKTTAPAVSAVTPAAKKATISIDVPVADNAIVVLPKEGIEDKEYAMIFGTVDAFLKTVDNMIKHIIDLIEIFNDERCDGDFDTGDRDRLHAKAKLLLDMMSAVEEEHAVRVETFKVHVANMRKKMIKRYTILTGYDRETDIFAENKDLRQYFADKHREIVRQYKQVCHRLRFYEVPHKEEYREIIRGIKGPWNDLLGFGRYEDDLETHENNNSGDNISYHEQMTPLEAIKQQNKQRMTHLTKEINSQYSLD